MSAPPAAEGPLLRVVAGDATPEEIAAVLAAVAAATDGSSAGAASAGTAGTSVWSAPGYAHRNIRGTFTAGPDGWRTSFWPR